MNDPDALGPDALGPDALWVFGYGSLIWRPDIPHEARVPGYIRGFVRRFWQGSTDHRGVPGAPGRVLTLVPQAEGRTGGAAYRVPRADTEAVLARLDHREKGGYERHRLNVHDETGTVFARALVYVAREDNPNFLGDAPLTEIAAQILEASGPSGPNREYLLRLHDALQQLGIDDPHTRDLAHLVTAELN
ncbi:MAG: gamma-glutamylcyclotransferase [Myxococcota bacterium]